MIRIRAILISLVIAAAALAIAVASRARDDAGDFIRRGKDAAEDGRIAQADSLFARAVSMAEGGERLEAMFLRAGVVRSGREAETLYRQLIDADPAGDYTPRAQLELAKIQYSRGLYEGAYATLHESAICEESEEACLFQGMSAVMLHRFDEARPALERVRKGRAKTWAALSLAEVVIVQGVGTVAAAPERRSVPARVKFPATLRAPVTPTSVPSFVSAELAATVVPFPL